MRKLAKEYFLTVAFCSILALVFCLFIFLPKTGFSLEERRVLADKPRLSLDNILSGSFEKETDSYLSDNFPGRKLMVGLYSYYTSYSGRNGENGIYRGKEGYLMNTPIADFSKLAENIKTANTFISQQGVDATIILAPSAASILEENLPRNHLLYREEALLKQAEAEFTPNNAWVDLSSLYQQQKTKGQLYYKTDHHWTTYGAYLGYVAYCGARGIAPLSEGKFHKTIYNNFYGTAYAKSGLWGKHGDTLEVWQAKANITVSISEDNKRLASEFDTMFFPQEFYGRDPYNIFLKGNHSLVKITNEDVNDGKLLVLKDSFANSLVPFLAQHYHDIYLVDLRYFRKTPVSSWMEDNNIKELLVLYSLDQFAQDDNILWLK